jgi:hypothetical protein
MEKSNQLFSELLQKIQALLEEYKCKSESRVNDQDAILYGKFSQYMEKYTIVVHVKEEQYKPVTAGARPVEKPKSLLSCVGCPAWTCRCLMPPDPIVTNRNS